MTREQSIVLIKNLQFIAGKDVDFKGMAVENELKELKKSPCPMTRAIVRYFQRENEKAKPTNRVSGQVIYSSYGNVQAPFLFLEDSFEDNELYVEVSKEFAKEMCDILQDPFILLRVDKDSGDLEGIDPSNPELLVVEKRLQLREILTDDESWRDVQLSNRGKTFSFPNELDKESLLCRLSLGWNDSRVKEVKICLQSFMGKLLEEESTMDLTIVAGNGAEIKCHKLIFAAHAPAFSAMLSSRTGMTEARSRRVEMKENSEDGIRHLLRYIYGKGMPIGEMCSDVALELFQTAHKYGLSELEISLLDMFLERSVEWFTPAGILELYLYVRNLKVFGKLREYSLRLLARLPSRKLRACEEFKKLSKTESIALFGKLVDYWQTNESDVRGTKRQMDSPSSSSDES